MSALEQTAEIPADGVRLVGDLVVPEDAAAVVAFAHGSGSGRRSPRNRQVAQVLQQNRLATLLLDLLTEQEEQQDLRTRALRFDIELLARRLIAAVDWLGAHPVTAGLGIGCFGASTGAAASVIAAAQRPATVTAVVSRGGRPDLAADQLGLVDAPTLLIVGGRDSAVVALNRDAEQLLRCPVRLEIVPGATHLFEEPGALATVASFAADWFTSHLRPPLDGRHSPDEPA